MTRIFGLRPKELRLGQWAMNCIHAESVVLYEYIMDIGCDPFYVDKNLPLCLGVVSAAVIKKESK